MHAYAVKGVMKQSIMPVEPDSKGKKKQSKDPSHIAWHPAFVAAIKLELEDYRNYIEIHPEFQLTSEPLRIDCLIVKKKKNVVIKKNIAAIFREVNLLEYKSPKDNLSVNDFYKVYAYACLYASFERKPITDLTISFVESCHPRELLRHLREIRKYRVEKISPGIYNIKGDIVPIQVIDSSKLSAEENLWLRDMGYKLDVSEANRLLREINKRKASEVIVYLDAIARANSKAIKEVMNMSNKVKSFEDILIETGYAARWEERKALDIAKNMINSGIPFKTIVSLTNLAPKKVKALYKTTRNNLK